MTGTFGGITPVSEIDNHELSISLENSLTSSLQDYYEELIEVEALND